LTKSVFLAVIIPLLLLTTYHAVFAQQKQALVIVSDNGFNDNDPSLPQYHIVGEVQNNGAQTAKFVQVSATLYDSSNKVIGTDFSFTNPSDIDPGQKAPFEITIGTDKVMGGDLSIIDHYAVQVSGQQQ
jgi:uncharacterized protein (TIGR02588 family)